MFKCKCGYCGLSKNLEEFIIEGLTGVCIPCQKKHSNFYSNEAKVWAELLGKNYIGGEDVVGNAILNKKVVSVLNGHLETLYNLQTTHPTVNIKDIEQKIYEVYVVDGKKEVPLKVIDFLKSLGINSVETSLQDTTKELRDKIRSDANYTCYYCGRYGSSVDHKEPVMYSLDNSPNNLVNSCKFCNNLKANLGFEEFLKLNENFKELNEELVQLDDLVKSIGLLLDDYYLEKDELILDLDGEELYYLNKEFKVLNTKVKDLQNIKAKVVNRRIELEKLKSDLVHSYIRVKEYKQTKRK